MGFEAFGNKEGGSGSSTSEDKTGRCAGLLYASWYADRGGEASGSGKGDEEPPSRRSESERSFLLASPFSWKGEARPERGVMVMVVAFEAVEALVRGLWRAEVLLMVRVRALPWETWEAFVGIGSSGARVSLRSSSPSISSMVEVVWGSPECSFLRSRAPHQRSLRADQIRSPSFQRISSRSLRRRLRRRSSVMLSTWIASGDSYL